MARTYTVTPYLCESCGKCELACAYAHPLDGRPGASRIKVFRTGPQHGAPIVCYQCDPAACVAVCPTQALVRNEDTGAIEVRHERCIKCRMCVGACPFGNIAWDEGNRFVHKCDLCKGDPACVRFCPTGALSFV